MAQQYRKKSPPVDVTEFTGQPIPGGFVNASDRPVPYRTTFGVRMVPAGCGLVPTLDGPLPVAPGDKLVASADGSITPVSADDFAAIFEPVPTA